MPYVLVFVSVLNLVNCYAISLTANSRQQAQAADRNNCKAAKGLLERQMLLTMSTHLAGLTQVVLCQGLVVLNITVCCVNLRHHDIVYTLWHMILHMGDVSKQGCSAVDIFHATQAATCKRQGH